MGIVATGRDTNRIPLHIVVPRAVPFALGLTPSDVCNFKCVYCNQSSEKGIREARLTTWEEFEEQVKQIEALYEKARANGSDDKIKIIRLIGNGEPLANKRIADMVRVLHDKKFADRIEITTNGSLLTHEMADQLIDAGLTRLLISVQGVNAETYKKVCGYNINFEKFVEQISYFYEKSRGKCTVFAKTVNIALKNQEEIDTFYKIFEPITDAVNIENVIQACEDVDYSALINEEEEKKTRYGNELKRKICCDTLFMYMNIHANGDVDCCGCIYPPRFIGNIYKTPIADLWNGEEHRKLMIAHLKGQRFQDPVCSRCSSIEHYNGFEADNLDPYREEILEKIMQKMKK